MHRLYQFFALLILSVLPTGFVGAIVLDIEIFNVQTQIVGSTNIVTGSGGPANYPTSPTASTGDFAVFDMNKDGADYADLKVTYLTDNGSIGSNIMIARTGGVGSGGSQGLEDDGTVSILMTIGDTSGGSVTLQFDWYAPGSFTGGVENVGSSSYLTDAINYTSFDIDFEQLVSIENDSFQSYTLDNPTDLTVVNDGTVTTFQDSGANSTFDDPKTAVGFLSNSGEIASHQISMGKQNEGGQALFMFEFRDPSEIVPFDDPTTNPVPEVSHFALVLGFGIMASTLLSRRRAYCC